MCVSARVGHSVRAHSITGPGEQLAAHSLRPARSSFPQSRASTLLHCRVRPYRPSSLLWWQLQRAGPDVNGASHNRLRVLSNALVGLAHCSCAVTISRVNFVSTREAGTSFRTPPAPRERTTAVAWHFGCETCACLPLHAASLGSVSTGFARSFSQAPTPTKWAVLVLAAAKHSVPHQS